MMTSLHTLDQEVVTTTRLRQVPPPFS